MKNFDLDISLNSFCFIRFSIILMALFSLMTGITSYPLMNNINKNITLNKIAFGSCFNTQLKSNFLDIFEIININNLDLFIWIGDSAYLDILNKPWHHYNEDFIQGFIDLIYSNTKNNVHYKELDNNKPVIGIWDDHDFGVNDGNSSFIFKDMFKKSYLKFIGEPSSSNRWQFNRSIHTSYSFGEGVKSVKFILIDSHYHKEYISYTEKVTNAFKSYFRTEKEYIKDFKNKYHSKYNTTVNNGKNNNYPQYKSMLGEEQWEFIEEQLSISTETLIFIVCGGQILPSSRIILETFYYEDRQRLFNLIAKYKKSGVIFLTGDIHQAQFLSTYCEIEDIGYKIREFTSSGLSHYCDLKIIPREYVDCSWLFEFILPHEYLLSSFINYNFGSIEFLWGDSKAESSVKLNIVDKDNIIQSSMLLNYGEDLMYRDLRDDNEQHDQGFKCSYSINSIGFYSLVLSIFELILDFKLLKLIVEMVFIILIIIVAIILNNKYNFMKMNAKRVFKIKNKDD